MGSFIDFTQISDTGKTKVFSITPKNSDQPIGRIAWFSNWRKYTFWPECNTIYDTKCLLEVIEFINQLMEDRKSEKAN